MNEGALAQAASAPAAPAPTPKDPSAGIDPQMLEAAQLMVARCRTALANDAEGVDAAMQADPIQAAVVNGVRVVRGMAKAADKAGRSMPFDVLMATGMQIIKDLAGIALEKGYLAEEDLPTFLKEVTQQSLRQYIAADLEDGTMTDDEFESVQAKLGGATPTAAPAQPAPGMLAAAQGA